MIGMFDSGVGGLTVLHALRQHLPNESILYFGDTARVPYGNKSKETICRYSLEIAEMLLERGIKILIVACNTASAHALEMLKSKLPIPVIGVVEPGAKAAAALTKNNKVALLATRSTVQSEAYTKALLNLSQQVQIFPQACPLLVPLIEEGYLDHPITRLALQEYLTPLFESKADTLLLGCTHYPLITPLLKKILPADIQIVDSAETLSKEVKELFEAKSLYSNSPRTVEFLVSDDPHRFNELGVHFLGEEIVATNADYICNK